MTKVLNFLISHVPSLLDKSKEKKIQVPILKHFTMENLTYTVHSHILGPPHNFSIVSFGNFSCRFQSKISDNFVFGSVLKPEAI